MKAKVKAPLLVLASCAKFKTGIETPTNLVGSLAEYMHSNAQMGGTTRSFGDIRFHARLGRMLCTCIDAHHEFESSSHTAATHNSLAIKPDSQPDVHNARADTKEVVDSQPKG